MSLAAATVGWYALWLTLFIGGPLLAGTVLGASITAARKRASGYRWHRAPEGGLPYLARSMPYDEIFQLPCGAWLSLTDRQRAGLDPVWTNR